MSAASSQRIARRAGQLILHRGGCSTPKNGTLISSEASSNGNKHDEFLKIGLGVTSFYEATNGLKV